MPVSRHAYWFILIVSLVAIGCGGVFVFRHLTRPSDGARLEPGKKALLPEGVILTPLEPHPGGLQNGDLVLAVEGRTLETWTETLFNRLEPAQWAFGQTLRYTIRRDGSLQEISVRLGRYPVWANLRSNWGLISFALVYLLVAGFVFVRKPENPAGRVLFLSAAALTSSTTWSFGLQINDFTDGSGFWIFKITTLLFYNLFWIASLHFALIFPRPLPVIRRANWILPVMYGLPYILLLVYLGLARSISSGNLDWFSRWTIAEGLHAAFFLLLTLVALFFQYRSNPQGATRQQMRWITFAGMLGGGGGLLFYILPAVLGEVLGLEAIDPNVAGILVLPFPIAIAIAILRHNLFDIDTLINRALVYGALTAITMALYVLIVGFLADFLQVAGRPLMAFLATGLVAVLFQPLRDRLQRGVNRLMYGERDDPVAVLTRLGTQLERTGSPNDALTGITETVARALKLPYVAIELGDKGAIAASYGLPKGKSIRLPLSYQSKTTGYLVVEPRSPGEAFSSSDLQLLANIAHQAGAAAHAAKLAADLRLSRQRLVTTREEERRRLRRDLHDGLGPNLASLTLKMDAARNLLRSDPDRAEQLIDELKKQTQATIQDIRDLVYELRPPALDQLGLAGAIQAFIDSQNIQQPSITFQAPDPLPPLPAALEVAAYRIALEGLHNVLRHSQARRANVCIALQNENLIVEIQDDGTGLPEDFAPGVGLASMQERAEELGGSFELRTGSPGLQIRACLPLLQEK